MQQAPVHAQPVQHWPFACNGSMQPAPMGVCATVHGPQAHDGSMHYSMNPNMGVWSGQQTPDGSMQFAMPHPAMGMCATAGPAPMMSHDGSMQFACHQQMVSMPSHGTSIESQAVSLQPVDMPQAPSRHGSGSTTPIVAAPWQGKHPDMQGSPFPMPLSPPHDLAHAGFSGNQQQAYFENWAPEGQQMGSMPGSGGAQILGLPVSNDGV